MLNLLIEDFFIDTRTIVPYNKNIQTDVPMEGVNMNNDVFVKLNLKSIGEVRSLIIDKENNDIYSSGKYLMCAGKYDRTEGWTIVFKAKNYKEAEYIIDNTPVNINKKVELKEIKFEEIKPKEVQLDLLDISITKKFARCWL